MTRNWHPSIGWCAALALICTLIPRPANAEDKGDKPIRLSATAQFAPIGTAYSFGTFAIDGRATYGEQRIWGGELIQTALGSNINVEIDGAGLVTLKNGAMARLALGLTRDDQDTPHQTLVASLLDGDLTIKLQKQATAYVESSGSSFTSSFGASFSIRLRDRKPILTVEKGTVDAQVSRRAPHIKGRTVRTVANRPPIPLGGASLNTRTNQSAQSSSEWRKYYDGAGTSGQVRSSIPDLVPVSYRPAPQSAQPSEVVANRLVRFHLEPPTLGSINPPEKPTDAQGIVTVAFTGAGSQGRGFIVADIDHDQSDPPDTIYEPYRRPVNVTKVFWTKTKLLLAASAVAVTVCLVACRPNSSSSLKQAPPPIIP